MEALLNAKSLSERNKLLYWSVRILPPSQAVSPQARLKVTREEQVWPLIAPTIVAAYAKSFVKLPP